MKINFFFIRKTEFFFNSLLIRIKLDGVGPVGNRPSTNLLHHFVNSCLLKKKKIHIWETPTLSTDADSRTSTNLKRLHDLSQKEKKKKIRGCVISPPPPKKKLRGYVIFSGGKKKNRKMGVEWVVTTSCRHVGR